MWRRRVLRVRVGGLGRLAWLLLVVSLILRGLEGRWWGKLLLRRGRANGLQQLRVGFLALLHDLRDRAHRLGVLELNCVLRRRSGVLWVLL